MAETNQNFILLEKAAEIISAYVSRNSIRTTDIPALIESVHASLGTIASGTKPEPAPEPLKPAVPIKKSITEEYIVCLEDGKRFKSLKRHLQSAYGLSPEDYRAKWGLPKDYPMVAPAYANARSQLAKTLGLGRKSALPVPEPVAAAPAPAPEPEAAPVPAPLPEPMFDDVPEAAEPAPAPAKKSRGRSKAAA